MSIEADYASLFAKMGGFTRYHFIQFVINFLLFGYATMDNFSSTFAIVHPGFVCGNSSVEFDCASFEDHNRTCSNEPTLSTTTYRRTLVSKFQLTCSNKQMLLFVPSVYMGGLLAGSLLLGPLIDRIGRKRVILLCALFSSAVNLGSALSNSMALYQFFRFLAGFATGSLFTATYTMVLENVDNTNRNRVAFGMTLAWPVGICFLSLVAFLCHGDFVYLHFCLAVCCLLLGLLHLFVVTESLRWLALHSIHKHEELLKAIKKINMINGRDHVLLTMESVEHNRQSKQDTILHLKNYPQNLKSLLTQIFLGFTSNGLVYYTFAIGIVSSSANVYTKNLYGGLVELTSVVFFMCTTSRVGRVPIQFLFIICNFVTILVMTIWKMTSSRDIYWLSQMCYLIGRFSLSFIGSTSGIHSVELVPTHIRGVGISFKNAFVFAGSLFAPQMFLLTEFWKPTPYLISSLLQLVNIFAVLTLPETRNKIMFDTLQQNEHFLKTAPRCLSRKNRFPFVNFRLLDFGRRTVLKLLPVLLLRQSCSERMENASHRLRLPALRVTVMGC
ncbi:Inorganic phosphate transporter pho84 [Cichlidogyrus casuarinus]|uniref:Inorganic phosphate transporter pho84 n=1 Tax=Cichlidogyrus casuarinus TaxID=1844966 RepID=A0ABD2QMZ6_9PLAT